MNQKNISALLFSLLLISGCTASKSPQEFSPPGFLDGLYTTRPSIEEPLIAILKLQNPALLETSERVDGKLVVDPQLLKAIEAEQKATIEELQKISSKIRVLIRYKLVLNGLAIWAPAETFEKIKSLPNVVMSEKAASFARPMETERKITPVGANTSVKFIGAESADKENLHGEGMKVGIIDTGIDYTHKMFLGEGTEEAYKNNDPSLANAGFPNKKVVGGIDFVGSKYNSASPNVEDRIPVPDANPLDEGGHGSHVAGTVAGLGDGINTYDGVAPAAQLYALKVFGAKGSTSDEVVIAALEYAIDPTGDLSFKDQLDVVNLSLGSSYGNPHIMYSHAIRNTVRGGTIVVASAGNSGDKKFIVGAPSVADDTISVANSVDNQDQNILFPTVELKSAEGAVNAEYVEGDITKSLTKIAAVQGEVIAVGLADVDFTSPLKEQIAGKVALIDRGKVNFSDKIKRAQEAGAIAVVMVNSTDEAPFIMGGDGSFDIPGVMISKKDGAAVKANLAKGVVIANLKSATTVQKPWLIDTIAASSSRGPRSEDGLIKPEISAPGTNIISAAMGGGAYGATMSGTSMAGPHVAGVMALLKQKFNTLTPAELKSVLMGHAKVITDADKKIYTVSRQGAGRVQIGESLKAQVISIPAALSFGITDVEKQKTLSQELTLKNIGTETVTLQAQWAGSAALKISVPSVTLAPGESKKITITAKVVASLMTNANDELDGFLKLSSDKAELLQIPALAVARQISQVKAKSVVVQSTSAADSAGSVAEVSLENTGVNKGDAYLFNLLGHDGRKKDSKPDLAHNKNCDMQSAGYRVIEKDGSKILQVAVKLYEGMTTWDTCEINVQVDSDRDGQTDQEIAGLPIENLPGLTGDGFMSLVLDGTAAREIRKNYEKAILAKPDTKEDYTKAIIDRRPMSTFDGSTLAIIEADVSALALSDTGELNIKVSTTHQDSGAIEYDDYLGKDETEWQKISISDMAQAFAQIPEVIELQGQEHKTVTLLKGYGSNDLILYAPQNRSVRDVLLEDTQSQIIPVQYNAE